jgi:hypothetical protein
MPILSQIKSLDLAFIAKNRQGCGMGRRAANRNGLLRAQIHARNTDEVELGFGMFLIRPQ